MSIEARLIAEVFRPRRGGDSRVSFGLRERFLREVAECDLVDSSSHNSDIVLVNRCGGKRLDVVDGRLAVLGGEERRTETRTESQVVRHVDDTRRGVVRRSLGVRGNQRSDNFLELVAGENGGRDKGGEDVDEAWTAVVVFWWSKYEQKAPESDSRIRTEEFCRQRKMFPVESRIQKTAVQLVGRRHV